MSQKLRMVPRKNLRARNSVVRKYPWALSGSMFRYRLLNRSWKSWSERDLEFLRRKKWAKKRKARVKNRKKSPEPKVMVFLG